MKKVSVHDNTGTKPFKSDVLIESAKISQIKKKY